MKKLLLPICVATTDEAGMRLRLGIRDKDAADWSGTVAVTPGKVTLIGGCRFSVNPSK